MRASRGFANNGFARNEYYNGVNFDNFYDVEPPKQRFAPIALRSPDEEYPQPQTRSGRKQQTSQS